MSNNKEKELGAGTSKATIGYTPDDYKKALGNTPYSTDTGDSTTDYYNALKNESYKTLLNSEVQASIARDQALKYTNNSLRAKGYATQGMAESTNLGLYSQYQNALSQAANTYNQSVNNIEEQKRNEELAQRKDNFESMTALMGSASNKEQLDNVMTTYGYNIKEDGTLDLSKSNLDENSKKQLQILYSMYNSQYTSSSGLDSLEALNNQTYVKTGGDNRGYVSTLGKDYAQEMKVIWHRASSGEYRDGTVIKVVNGQNEHLFLRWENNQFRIIATDEKMDVGNEAYNSAKNKETIKWSGGKINYSK